jgi:hypothetical protein
VQVITSQTFSQCRLNQMMIGGLLMHWNPTIDLEGAFQRPSATMLSVGMRDVAQEPFQSKLDTVLKDIQSGSGAQEGQGTVGYMRCSKRSVSKIL